MSIRLSVLDYASIDVGSDAETAVAAMDRLALRAEELGYEHFWLPEHHGFDFSASTAPEMLIARLASITTELQIGSGGIMLPNYSAYKVAESFLTMATFAPGRINLGVGSVTGAGRAETIALNDEKERHFPFERKVADLLGFLGAQHAEGSTYEGMQAHPRAKQLPTPWVLSSSGNTAGLAAQHGTGFTFAHFINPGTKGPKAAQLYRQQFTPSIFGDTPEVMVAVFVAVADDQEHAELLAKAFHLWLLDTQTRNPGARLRSLDEVADIEFTAAQQVAITRNADRILVGTGHSVLAQLEQLARNYGTDHMMVNPYVPGARNRQRALELLAEARDGRAS